jgi:hypothetical protein
MSMAAAPQVEAINPEKAFEPQRRKERKENQIQNKLLS